MAHSPNDFISPKKTLFCLHEKPSQAANLLHLSVVATLYPACLTGLWEGFLQTHSGRKASQPLTVWALAPGSQGEAN